MFQNGLKWSKIFQNSSKCSNYPKHSNMFQHGPKQLTWSKMVQKGSIWYNFFPLNCPKSSKIVQICPKSSKTVQNCQKWSKMVQYGFLPLFSKWVRLNQVPRSFFCYSIYHEISRSLITKPPGTFIAGKAAYSGGQVTGDMWRTTCDR